MYRRVQRKIRASKKKDYTFYLEDEIVDKMELIAKEEGRSLSGQINFSLKSYLKMKEEEAGLSAA